MFVQQIPAVMIGVGIPQSRRCRSSSTNPPQRPVPRSNLKGKVPGEPKNMRVAVESLLSSKREFEPSKPAASRAGRDFYYHCDAATRLLWYTDNGEVRCAREHRFALFFRNGKLWAGTPAKRGRNVSNGRGNCGGRADAHGALHWRILGGKRN